MRGPASAIPLPGPAPRLQESAGFRIQKNETWDGTMGSTTGFTMVFTTGVTMDSTTGFTMVFDQSKNVNSQVSPGSSDTKNGPNLAAKDDCFGCTVDIS